jgi:hypothetical protein
MSEDRRRNPVGVGDVYLHVSNSGISFGIVDEGFGPTIKIHTSAFGNISQFISVHVDREALQKLSELFAKAANEDYTDEYCHAARLHRWNFGDGVQYAESARSFADNKCEEK